MRPSLREVVKFFGIDVRELLRLKLSLKEFNGAGGAFRSVGPAAEYDNHMIQVFSWGIMKGQMLHFLDRILVSSVIWLE